MDVQMKDCLTSRRAIIDADVVSIGCEFFVKSQFFFLKQLQQS